MQLQVQPVALSDFDVFLTFTDEDGGTVTDPLILDLWPADTPSDRARRNAWSIAQQRWKFQNDKTASFVKVVDIDADNEVLSVARWHCYENGYPAKDTWTEIDGFAPPPLFERKFPLGLMGDALIGFVEAATKERLRWSATAGPCWILTTLITRTRHRKHGAGGLLIDWGTSRAAAAGLVSCLEADPAATSLYARHGFTEQGVITLDGSEFGLDGGDLTMVKMSKEAGSPCQSGPSKRTENEAVGIAASSV